MQRILVLRSKNGYKHRSSSVYISVEINDWSLLGLEQSNSTYSSAQLRGVRPRNLQRNVQVVREMFTNELKKLPSNNIPQFDKSVLWNY